MFKTSRDRLTEVQLYELVAKEIENNRQSKGLWAKAFADTEGDFEKAKALYIKLRVQMIKDELVEETRLIRDEWANKVRQSEEAEQDKPQKAEELFGIARSAHRKTNEVGETGRSVHRQTSDRSSGLLWFFALLAIVYGIFIWVNNDF